MSRMYRAYGMDLDAEVALAGMRAATDVDPSPLRLDAVRKDDLARIWSGPTGSGRPVSSPSGQLTHGGRLRVEAGRGRDWLLTWDGGLVHHLDRAGAVLSCEPPADLDAHRVLVEVVLPCVAILRGADALHAAAVRMQDGVVLIAGDAGARAAITVDLLARGHDLLAWNFVVLSRTRRDQVLAHPATPHLEVEVGSGELAPQVIGRTVRRSDGSAWVTAHRFAAEPVPVDAVCLLKPVADCEAALRALPASPLVLEPHTTLADERRVTARRSRDLQLRLCAQARMWRLLVPHGDVRAAADLVERAPRSSLMEVAA